MIDLRSDWVAPPTDEMWEAMRAGTAESVTRLELLAAAMLGKEAALWTPTCSAANLVALMTLCEPGQRVALQDEAHILTNEGMGIDNVAGLEPVPLADAAGAALLCLENTHTRAGGTVLALDETARLAGAVPLVHLDGARLPNAAVALGVSLAELAAPADTVALSLNKGLCAPMGAVLAGDEAVIRTAHENLRRIGGASVHKAGIAAEAAIVGLERMLERLADDHRRARELAQRLGDVEGVTAEPPATNIVFFAADGIATAAMLERLAERGVLGYFRDERRVRFVTHRLIDDESVERAAAAVADAIRC